MCSAGIVYIHVMVIYVEVGVSSSTRAALGREAHVCGTQHSTCVQTISILSFLHTLLFLQLILHVDTSLYLFPIFYC